MAKKAKKRVKAKVKKKPGEKRVRKKQRMGRPLVKINRRRVEALARAGCSANTIALLVGVDEKTLRNRCANLVEKAKAKRRLHLRVVQNGMMDEGSERMAIHLGKNELGQVDAQSMLLDTKKPVVVAPVLFGSAEFEE